MKIKRHLLIFSGLLTPNITFACVSSLSSIFSAAVFVSSLVVFVIILVVIIYAITKKKQPGFGKVFLLVLSIFFIALTFASAYGYYKETQKIKQCKEKGNQFCNPLDC